MPEVFQNGRHTKLTAETVKEIRKDKRIQNRYKEKNR